jgi:hypothetical protein
MKILNLKQELSINISLIMLLNKIALNTLIYCIFRKKFKKNKLNFLYKILFYILIIDHK